MLTEEDLSPGWLAGVNPVATATLPAQLRSPLKTATQVTAFTAALIADCLTRHINIGPFTQVTDVAGLVDWARKQRLDHVVTAHIPVGPAADQMSALRPALAAHNIRLHSLIRPYDAQARPFAASGFFEFRDAIPRLVAGFSAPNNATQRQAELPFP